MIKMVIITYLKLINNYNRNSFLDYLSYIFCFLFIISGSIVSVVRYWQYEVFYYDFGIFDQAIWNVSRLKAPIIDHLAVGGKWIFADHFNPSIFLLSPLYWLTERSEILLVAQSLIVGLSGLILYKIGLEITKNRIVSLSVLSCYLLFVGTQNAVITDFHEATISTLPFLLTFWAAIRNKPLWYFIFLIITLGFKESNFLLGIGIGIALFFIKKDWFKISIITLLISSLWGFLSIKLIIPYFSGGIYQYSTEFPNRISQLFFLFDAEVKRRTIFFSFLSFGFLSLLSPAFYFLILQDLFVRFYPIATTRWDLGLHYSIQLAAIFGTSALYGYRFITKYIKFKNIDIIISLALFINIIFLHRFILHGPFGLSYNGSFYKHTSDFSFLDELIKKIPKNASIMTQNNLAVRFDHQKVWILRPNYSSYKPNYILIDNRKGQSPNNFFGSQNVETIIASLLRDSDYKLVYSTGEQYVFKEINLK
ncbi:MAG: DUF2079 domain-containing protein [Patescibacteria group bacterium]